MDYQRYIARAAEAAKASKKLYGVPRAVTIAQSILESGWGRSGLSAKQEQLLRHQMQRPGQPLSAGLRLAEVVRVREGKKKKYVSRFRIYSSMERSFLDHGRLLNRADRYNAAFRYTKDPDRFIREVHKAGYATDPKYATSVINLMRKWNLYRFDSAPRTAARPDPNLALIRTVAPLAQRSEAATGVPSSVTIAQALYHSSAGRSTLAKKARNYFGLTCKGRSKHAKKACLKQGKTKYRTYASLKNSVADQAAVLSTTKHYAAAMKKRNSPKGIPERDRQGALVDQKSYAGTVYKLITRYGLTKYDLLINITLKQGSRGAKVIALQHLLRARGAR
ncbi:MAG: glucosaminidase domain-containing protein [Micropruina sp.]